MRISRHIRNTGKRKVNDIVLSTGFFADEDSVRYHTASSPDGSPPGHYRTHMFTVTMDDLPDTAEGGIQVVISDGEFQIKGEAFENKQP